MEVESATLFAQTSSRYRPTMVDIMKVDSLEGLDNLTTDETKPKRKYKMYGLLTPNLAKAVASIGMKITSVFLKVIEIIKASITPPAEGTVKETEDRILTRISEHYDHLLYFLWASHKFPNDVKSPPMVAIQDESALSWEKESREASLGKPEVAKTVDLTSDEIRSVTPDGAITAMTSLSLAV